MTNPTRKDDPIEFHMGHLLSDIRSRIEHDNTTAEQDEYIGEVRELIEGGLKQAREDTFNTVRDALKHRGRDDRWTFIQYCLTGFVESGMTGFLLVEYDSGMNDYEAGNTPGLPENTPRREARALVINQGDEYYSEGAVKRIVESGKVCANCGTPLPSTKPCPRNGSDHEPEQALFEITHETIELGLQRIRHATDAPDKGPHPEQRNQTSVPYLGRGLRNAIIQADLTHEAGDLDVWGYSMIVEVALFGEGRYA